MSEYKPKFCKDVTQERINDILDYLELNKKREADLELKKITSGSLLRVEEYELAMCKFEIKKAVRFLE